MKVAVIQFPGSNCDQDGLVALRCVGVQAEYVWHEQSTLAGFDAVWVPGGFSYGDYLRCGAMAARSPVMGEVIKAANEGKPVFGVCNGFQILCETGLLPGALMTNINQKFLCQDVYLRASNTSSMFTCGVASDLRIPIAHGEGRYVIDEDGLKALQDNDQIAFHYVSGPYLFDGDANPNGSVACIAGVLNAAGNVMGMMPHPERAISKILGCEDGLPLVRNFVGQLLGV